MTYLFSMNNRIVGYAVIFFLIVFLLVPTVYLAVQVLAPVHHRTIIFEAVNTLSFLHLEDPVRVRGLQVGAVRSISGRDGKTYVEVETRSELPIREGYRIMAEDKGFMGDRYVAISPGDPGRPLLDKKEVLKGSYLLGPTEAIASIGRLSKLVDSVSRMVRVLRQGSAANPSFIARFNGCMRSLDSITGSLKGVLIRTNRGIERNADSLAEFVGRISALSDSLGSTVPGAVASLESVIAKMGKLLADVDSLSRSSGDLVDRLHSKEALALDEKCRTLRDQLQALREAVTDLHEYGLRLPVRIR